MAGAVHGVRDGSHSAQCVWSDLSHHCVHLPLPREGTADQGTTKAIEMV